jgi:hypothetical protein
MMTPSDDTLIKMLPTSRIADGSSRRAFSRMACVRQTLEFAVARKPAGNVRLDVSVHLVRVGA